MAAAPLHEVGDRLGDADRAFRLQQGLDHRVLDHDVVAGPELGIEELQHGCGDIAGVRGVLDDEEGPRQGRHYLVGQNALQVEGVAGQYGHPLRLDALGRNEVHRDHLGRQPERRHGVRQPKGAAAFIGADLDHTAGPEVPQQLQIVGHVEGAEQQRPALVGLR